MLKFFFPTIKAISAFLLRKRMFNKSALVILGGFLSGASGKESTFNSGATGDPEVSGDPWSGRIPWRSKWQPTPVLLPGTSHRQRSLVGYSPWGRKESDMTE